jgi:cysteinyl-tRNA synthetase
VLGLDLHRVWDPTGSDDEVPEAVLALLDARDAARAARDYGRADALRDEIGAAGFDVIDAAEGSSVRRRR